MLFNTQPPEESAAAFMHYAIVFSRTPIPSISQRTTSPDSRYFCTDGYIPRATPLGVPVAMIVPALSVMPADSSSII